MMKVIVAGSRNFHDYDTAKTVIVNALNGVSEPLEFISGGAAGADSLGERYAKENNIHVTRFLPDWDTYGRSAGPRRNRKMAEYASDNGMLIAFWNGKSKGTKSMVEYAKLNNLKVVIHQI